MIKKLSLILICVLASVTGLRAQTDPQFTQYYQVPSYYNPAAIGNTDYIRIRGGARLQWVGIDHAPMTFAATADMPLKVLGKRIGLGVAASQDKAGLYSTLDVRAQAGYKLRKWGGEFTGAISVGLFSQGFKGSEVYLPDDDDYHESTDDGIPMQDVRGSTVDFGAGIWYEHPRFWAGISASHLTSPTVRMKVPGGESSGTSGAETGEKYYEFNTKRTLYFMGGCNIPLRNTLFELAPSVLVRSDFTFTTGQVDLRARYNRMFTFGVGYRYKDAITATLAAEIKQFFIGYSFDYSTTAIAKASSGSHEVFVGYSLKLDMGEKNTHRHKNIRLM